MMYDILHIPSRCLRYPFTELIPWSRLIPYLCNRLVFVHTAFIKSFSTILLLSRGVRNLNRMNASFDLLSPNTVAVGPARRTDFNKYISSILFWGNGVVLCRDMLRHFS